MSSPLDSRFTKCWLPRKNKSHKCGTKTKSVNYLKKRLTEKWLGDALGSQLYRKKKQSGSYFRKLHGRPTKTAAEKLMEVVKFDEYWVRNFKGGKQ